jgi:hypothetical protein
MSKTLSTFILCSLTSLTFAVQAQEFVTVPELDGGFTASVGTFYAIPSTPNQNQGSRFSADNLDRNTNTGNSFGTQGSVGYIFDNSANGVEISGRTLN